jgi:glycosyltransferase involved in cell wall biosynthesis
VRVAIASKGSVLFGRKSDLVGVDVIAPVADVRPLFHRSAVAAAPLRGGLDIRTSVFEPMAAGIPVVVSARVLERLNAKNLRSLSLAGDPTDFALALIQILSGPERRAALAESGRAYVIAEQAWGVMAQRMTEIVEGAVRPRGGAAAGLGSAASDQAAVSATHVSANGERR